MYFIQHCFICRSSDFTVSEDAVIEPGTITARLRLCLWQSDDLTTRLDLIHKYSKYSLNTRNMAYCVGFLLRFLNFGRILIQNHAISPGFASCTPEVADFHGFVSSWHVVHSK
jgi:hypothetical protein